MRSPFDKLRNSEKAALVVNRLVLAFSCALIIYCVAEAFNSLGKLL